MKLQDKVGFITGAASGIGRATAILAAKEGAQVIVGDIDDQHGEETVSIIDKEGGRASFLHVDVTDEDNVRKAVEHILANFKKIDFLHNNAGGWQILKKESDSLAKETLIEWSHWINLNLTPVFLVSKYVAENMRSRRIGSIVNTSSTYAFYPYAGQASYSSAKAGIIALTKSLAIELGPFNIRVNAVCPGETMTPQWCKTYNGMPQSTVEALKRTIPLGRFGEPEEVGRAVVWLASDEASYVSGAALIVDGGQTAGASLSQE